MATTYHLTQEELEEACRKALQEKYPNSEDLKDEEYEIELYRDGYSYQFGANVTIQG